MSWPKSIIVGLVAGALFSVLPLELMMMVPVVLAVLVAHFLGVAVRVRNVRLFVPTLGLLSVAVATTVAAAWAPVKYVDRKTFGPLETPCTAVRDLVSAMDIPESAFGPGVNSEALDRTVCVANSRPTLREVSDALEKQTGLKLLIGYCGTSATILWGGYPIGGPSLELAKR